MDYAVDSLSPRAVRHGAELGKVSDVRARSKARVDADVGSDDSNSAADLLRRRTRVEAEHLHGARLGRQQRADDPERGRLAGAVGAEQTEDLTGIGFERNAAQDLVLAERLLQAINRDRRRAHLVLLVRAFVAFGLVDGGLALVPTVRLAG